MPSLLLDFLFPASIQEHGEALLQMQSAPVVLRFEELRSLGVQALDRVIAVAEYDEAPELRRAIHHLKYRQAICLAPMMGKVLARAYEAVTPEQKGTVVLCPVPLHWTRMFRRGFNQSAVLAQETAWQWKCPVTHLLTRTRRTPTQTKRGREERFKNVHDAFMCSVDAPKHVILIDDVCTTGATLDACAEALKKQGAMQVEALVLAHG